MGYHIILPASPLVKKGGESGYCAISKELITISFVYRVYTRISKRLLVYQIPFQTRVYVTVGFTKRFLLWWMGYIFVLILRYSVLFVLISLLTPYWCMANESSLLWVAECDREFCQICIFHVLQSTKRCSYCVYGKLAIEGNFFQENYKKLLDDHYIILK